MTIRLYSKKGPIVEVPRNWLLIFHGKTMKGDRYWSLDKKVFKKAPPNKRVTRFELIIRKQRKAA